MDIDLAVFIAVCLLRLGIPLLILRFPLPAILAALVLDAADQTIFQSITTLDLDELNYQGYDKALDVYYLTIAYIATFRNWRSAFAIAVGAFLWYWRLVGVALFELTQWRPLLLIFPNTFEYFFIFMAIVRLGWDELRLTNNQLVTAAAAIWVVIKLPQEWWIHIAKLDVTEFIKVDLLGVLATDSVGTAISNRPAVAAAMAVVVVALVGGMAVVWRRLPHRDHRFIVDADRLPHARAHGVVDARHWSDGLMEKIVLVGLVTIIFAQAVPTTDVALWKIVVGVVGVVGLNSVVSQVLLTRGGGWRSTATAFGGTLVVNGGILVVMQLLLPSSDGRSDLASSAFFLLILSLIVALFDRYRPVAQWPTPGLEVARVRAATA